MVVVGVVVDTVVVDVDDDEVRIEAHDVRSCLNMYIVFVLVLVDACAPCELVSYM